MTTTDAPPAKPARSHRHRSEVRDGMRIDWDVPITMDDGLVLRADVFRPVERGTLPGAAELWPLRQGSCLPGRLSERVAAHGRKTSRRHRRIEQPLSELGSGRSREVGAARLCVRARRFPRHRLFARRDRSFLAARDEGLLRLHRMGRRAAVVERQGRAQRHFLLRHQPVAGGDAAAAAPRGDVHLGGRRRLVPRHDASRRHPLHVLGKLVRHAGQDRAVRRGRTRQALARFTANWCAGRRLLSEAELERNRSAFGDDIRAHPLDDDYHKARSPIWSKVKTPFLSAANWGGQPLHPRGNFEGFVRAAAKDKWLEVHGIEHWTHFYTDYGRELQLRFFDYFLHGKQNGWDKQPRVHAAGASSGRDVRRARRGRMAAQAHANGPSSISIRRTARSARRRAPARRR